ncbi:hypothetical protein RB200_19710 [Streptomyces sp. PmtG]
MTRFLLGLTLASAAAAIAWAVSHDAVVAAVVGLVVAVLVWVGELILDAFL